MTVNDLQKYNQKFTCFFAGFFRETRPSFPGPGLETLINVWGGVATFKDLEIPNAVEDTPVIVHCQLEGDARSMVFGRKEARIVQTEEDIELFQRYFHHKTVEGVASVRRQSWDMEGRKIYKIFVNNCGTARDYAVNFETYSQFTDDWQTYNLVAELKQSSDNRRDAQGNKLKRKVYELDNIRKAPERRTAPPRRERASE